MQTPQINQHLESHAAFVHFFEIKYSSNDRRSPPNPLVQEGYHTPHHHPFANDERIPGLQPIGFQVYSRWCVPVRGVLKNTSRESCLTCNRKPSESDHPAVAFAHQRGSVHRASPHGWHLMEEAARFLGGFQYTECGLTYWSEKWLSRYIWYTFQKVDSCKIIL